MGKSCIILISVRVVERPPFGKELFTLLPHFVFVICLFVVLVISRFGFDDRLLVLIVPVPGHCLPFTLATRLT